VLRKLLQEMSWSEAKEAFRETKLAIVPVGSIEQHGPHMPLGTDFLIADYLAKRVGSEAGAIVAPAVPIGFAAYHGDFPGTLSVSIDTLARYIWELCSYLARYGITHIIFINGHGGNLEALQSVARKFRDRGLAVAIVMWWEIAGQLNPDWTSLGHGDINETSVVLAIAPQTVNLEKAETPVNKKLTPAIRVLNSSSCEFKNGVLKVALRASDVSDRGDFIGVRRIPGTGIKASPKNATAERGRKILDAVVRYIVDFSKEFQKVSFEPVIQ